MKDIWVFGDERILGFCTYCGGRPETRDHVPARVFLDDPLPENLPVVPSCAACNSEVSMDEEYLACLIEVVICGSTVPIDQMRPKVRAALTKRPALAARLRNAMVGSDQQPTWMVEDKRVNKVLLKMGRGHILWELHEHVHEEPSTLLVLPLCSMSDDERERFEAPIDTNIWPEIGSRAFTRLVQDNGGDPWVTVQEGRYRFMATVASAPVVKIVISEYLACIASWEET